ncbi:hypothetical protein ACWF95_39780 [Streptomyces vinaceus]
MATSSIVNGNVLCVKVEGAYPLTIDMSLQRHHYRYCGSATVAGELNSLLHADVDDDMVRAEGVEVGDQLEALLKKSGGKWAPLFGKTLTVTSKRTYLVDNSALNPSGAPNHFFVTGGDSVWAGMSQGDFITARDVRRIEEVLAERRARKDKTAYLDPKEFRAKAAEPGARTGNPVVAAVLAARANIGQASADDTDLSAASGRDDIVAIIRAT